MYIINIMHIITILRIIVCFERRHKGAFEGIGSSVCCSRGRKKEQYPSIRDCTGRNVKGSMVDTRWPNHDEVQAVTAVKGFAGNELQYIRCKPFFLVCPSTKQLYRAKCRV